MSDNNDIQAIATYLEISTKMQAYEIINGPSWSEKTNGEKIFFLHQMGFSPNDIAIIVGTTIGTVRKEISVRSK